jgi:PAS domain S-box-containing protein
MSKARPAKSPSRRLTIGLLIGRLGDIGYAAQVWPGVADVAEERDVNLVCFVGGTLCAPHEFDSQRNVAYDLASPERLDGLLAMSGSIGQFVGPEQLKEFYAHFQPLPMVSIAMAVDGIPNVLTDSLIGVKDSINHLIEVHHFRQIAFLRGPETNPEAEQRYETYVKTLAEHAIPFKPELVVSGDYLGPAGAEAVRLLLDERKVKFEAIASANDEMAIGAMNALRERGLNVPEDVSVVGFDDLEEAKFASPPLTTIRQPMYEQGRRATEMLLALMAGEDVPKSVTLPTELVIRQSCGCQPREESRAIDPSTIQTGETFEAVIAANRALILSDMAKTAGVSAASLGPGWAERLLEAFSITLNDPSRNDFIHTLDEMLHKVGTNNGAVMEWRQVLFSMQNYMSAALANQADRSRVEKLLQQGQALVGEIAQWAQAHLRLLAERRAFDFTIGISEPLMTAFDVEGLTEVVARQLPQLGIESCYISLYEQSLDEQKDVPTEWSRLILAFNENGRMELEPGGRRFQSRQLIPEGILPKKKRYAILLEPLHFRDETQLGFIILGPLKMRPGAALREALSRQISTALKGALLLQERSQTQEALQRSEEKYRSLLEFNGEILGNAPIGIIRMDKEMRIQYENPQLEKIIGLPAEAPRSRAIGTDIRQIPGIQLAGLLPYLDDLQKGKDILLETPFNSIYGRTTFIRINGRPICDQDQQVGSILLVEDISERQLAEEAFRESEERYRAVIEATDTGYVVIDESGRVINANMNYAHLSGHASVDEILGREVIDWTAPYDLERNRNEVINCFKNGSIKNLEIDYQHADGKITPVEMNANVVQTKEGKVVVTLCRDITERKQAEEALEASEERYRSLAEASHDMIFIIGVQGMVEYVNEFGSRQFGLQPELIVGMKMKSLFSNEAAERQQMSLARVMATGKPAYIEAPSGFPGGERWLGTWLVPLRDRAGRTTSVMGVSRDITDRIRIDQALKEYSERLEEMVGERTTELQEALQKAQLAGQLKTEFIANINHELRTPLTNLVLYHQMLRANPDVKTLERLDVIGREIQRLRVLIEDMLKLSRLDTGQVAFRPMPQDLNRIIQTLVSDRKTIAEGRGLTLTVELQPGLPAAWLDEVMVVQIVSNLLTNALNYTPSGGQLHISTRRTVDHSGKSWVAFIVQDTGPGISPEDLPHLFDRFYRGKAGHATGVPGTGLGLAIVKQMVEKHNGRLDVKNVPDGHGAIFTVWLPVEQEPEAG